MKMKRGNILSELKVLCLVMFSIIVVSYISNLIQVYKETIKLKETGKTPLVGRNLTTVTTAFLGEVGIVTLSLYLLGLTNLTKLVVGVIVSYLALQALRNVSAYLIAWGTWSIFLKYDQHNMKKQIEKDKEEAL